MAVGAKAYRRSWLNRITCFVKNGQPRVEKDKDPAAEHDMRDGLKERIQTVCATQFAHSRTQLEQQHTSATAHLALLERFLVLRRDVIRGVMHEFACYFSDQLYTCRIINDDDHKDQIGRRMFKAGITFRLYKGASSEDELRFVPHYSIFFDHVNSVVRYYRSNTTKSLAGECGFDGKSELAETTADLIERKLLAFTNWLFEERASF